MAENNIENSDKDYLDEAFIRKINNSEINSLLSLMKELLENYRTELNYEQFQYFNNEKEAIDFLNEVYEMIHLYYNE